MMDTHISPLGPEDMAIAYRALIRKKEGVVRKIRARIERDQLVLLATEADLSRLEAAYQECLDSGPSIIERGDI